MMNADKILATADDRIQEIRTANVDLALVDGTGHPISDAEVGVQLTTHWFKFGCNGFGILNIDDAGLQEAYMSQFSALLNYATLPFYWGSYEREESVTREEKLREMAQWCIDHNIARKGHPLAWHEVFPQWADAYSDDEVLAKLEARVRKIVSDFKGLVDIWDVVNEATVSHRFENAIGRQIAKHSALQFVYEAINWAREENPDATLLYNDFNISPEFEKLIEDLIAKNAPFDVIGIQSHMHVAEWSLERAWDVCETYARFGMPLHFTELTVLSGRYKDHNEKDWHKRHTNWDSTPEGEQKQVEYCEKLYTLLFSHPAVEAITWWDFADGGWQGAPAGMIRKDMSPKPFYERLMELVHGEWSTDYQGITDESGSVLAPCFYGEHTVTVKLPSGDVLTGAFEVTPSSGRKFTVTMQ
jgi:GH35 family endo-1,4-beta-xylanase